MTDDTPHVDGTPCLISSGIVTADNTSQHTNSVSLHSRSSPCGWAFQGNDPPVPTFVEFVEEWLGEYAISVRPCKACGGDFR